jgi:hypothetical protein
MKDEKCLTSRENTGFSKQVFFYGMSSLLYISPLDAFFVFRFNLATEQFVPNNPTHFPLSLCCI